MISDLGIDIEVVRLNQKAFDVPDSVAQRGLEKRHLH
jgi:hypothetical protein